jgi:formylglycine-generating enzyme required for sulfatase activity/dienelactone hydrolase
LTGTVVDHFRILEKLGQGGMGVVYKAEDLKLRRTVALKFLLPHLAGDEEIRQRFLHEARAVASLAHPNICVVHEVNEEHSFLVMEYLEGETVSAKAKRRPLPIEEALDLAVQAGRGLEAAHRKAVVHRDVKSVNLMVTADGQVKVMDFGLAQVGAQTRLTKTGTSIGTPPYMSPEQFRSERVDHRTDVWSFGVVLYEMIAGRMPFQGETEAALMYSVLEMEPEALTALRTDVPVELERVVRKTLAKDPGRRYQHVEDLLVDLKAIRKVPVGAAPKPKRLASKWPVVAAAAILAIAAALILFREKRRHDSEQLLARIQEHMNAQEYMEAWVLARKAGAESSSDPRLQRAWKDMSVPCRIESDPPGAEVYVRPYADPGGAEHKVGITPINTKVPLGYMRWRFQKQGFESRQLASYPFDLPANVKLTRSGSERAGMVSVSGGNTRVGQRTVQLGEFQIGESEVTNAEFKAFVDAGGYRDRRFWRHPVLDQGREVPWEKAIERFRDSTGRPGPATWELGTFPEGGAQYPVTGVSWYEAAAYAEFAGKSLPTVYHWFAATDTNYFLLDLSNFGGKGIAPVRQFKGISRFGAYDMAGNAREWSWSELGDRRYILGGAWNEAGYMYRSLDAMPPLDRSDRNGFRCVKFSAAPPPESLAPLTRPYRDYSREKPVSDEVFATIRSLYAYDKKPLNAKVDRVDTSNPQWRKEEVTLDAAYGNERLSVYLFLPPGGRQPYQAVVHFPGSLALMVPEITGNFLDYTRFVVQSGRVLVYPIYKGTYGRRTGKRVSGEIDVRQRVVQWSNDLGRTIDYLETRQDIDRDRIAYHGFSMGASTALPLVALEPRIRTVVLWAGGLFLGTAIPERDPLNFVSRIRVPVLMISGRYDFLFPLEHSQRPLMALLGTPPADKKHVLIESGHNPPPKMLLKETLDWLDKYLGPVQGAP